MFQTPAEQADHYSSTEDVKDMEKFSSVKFDKFYLPDLTVQSSDSLFSRCLPEHLTTCTDTFNCVFPCPYEGGFNKYLYLNGSIFSDERMKLGPGRIIMKHEFRSSKNFLKFIDYRELFGKKSPYVGIVKKKVAYRAAARH